MENLVDVSKLITVAEYARMKKVAPVTVYRWLETGRIAGIEIAGVKFVVKETKGGVGII